MIPLPDTDEAVFAKAAAQTIAHMIKLRARDYAKRPMSLDALYPGLSCAATDALIAIADHLVERETSSPRRWFGFGGEVSLVNAKAARLLGRTQRRHARRLPRDSTRA